MRLVNLSRPRFSVPRRIPDRVPSVSVARPAVPYLSKQSVLLCRGSAVCLCRMVCFCPSLSAMYLLDSQSLAFVRQEKCSVFFCDIMRGGRRPQYFLCTEDYFELTSFAGCFVWRGIFSTVRNQRSTRSSGPCPHPSLGGSLDMRREVKRDSSKDAQF